ncbi:MAG: hypothetical protein OEX23_08945 [Betaproteobacteria bacterium]|nr:hypothetical protein [Betaproteobacteria bacterium]
MKAHWLDRPGAARRAWIAFAVVLSASVLAQLFIAVEPHFAAEGWFGMPAVVGVGACAAMVLFAKLVGAMLKRRDDYYGDGSGE